MFSIAWMLFIVSIAAVCAATVAMYTRVPQADARALALALTAIETFAPLLFAIVPRRVLQAPQLAIIAWWPAPLTTAGIGLHLFGQFFDGAEAGALLLLAMFTPVIVVGVFRRRNGPQGATR